jgi:hypothetical protein
VQQIPINPIWNVKVRALGEKFNQYVQRHSARLISDLVEQLLTELDNPDPVLRFDVALLLREIRERNEAIIVYEYSKKIDQVLFGEGKGEPIRYAGASNQYSEDFTGDLMRPTESKPPTMVVPPSVTPAADLGYWTEEELAKNNQQPEQQGENEGGGENLMQMPIEALKLKNVHKVPMKTEYAKRKCAMGDGEFEDYSGELWECKCGTLYHPACLKVQAIFSGTCVICDLPFRNATTNK